MLRRKILAVKGGRVLPKNPPQKNPFVDGNKLMLTACLDFFLEVHQATVKKTNKAKVWCN